MKKLLSSLFVSSLLVGLSGCSSEDNQSTATLPETKSTEAPAPVTDKSTTTVTSTDELKETAKEWTEKTGELASEAWNVTKDKTAETSETVAEKSREYYETAKDKTVEVSESVVEKSKEVYESGKEKSTELLNDINK